MAGSCPSVWSGSRVVFQKGNIQFSTQVGKYRNAAVAADATICSKIGTDILQRGGSAVDAAIGCTVSMGVANMQSTGLGGGFFATIYNSNSKSVAVLDAREEAPVAATESKYVGDPSRLMTGGLAISVPGQILGCWEMYQKYGRLPWADLIQPSIDLCEKGFPIAGALSRAISANKEVILDDPELRQCFVSECTDELLQEGDTMKCPKLARTFRVLATEGGTSFYNGSLAKDVAADISDAGGIITVEDLQSYQAKWKTPLTLTLDDGLTVHSSQAPSGGGILLLLLNILEGYNFRSSSLQTDEDTILTYHRIIEAMKFAYARRTELGDSDFVDVTELEKNMTSRVFGESLRKMISDDQTFDYKYYGPSFYDTVDPGTAHLSLMDAHGNAVSLTSTINKQFGSKVAGKRTGIVFNGAMNEFSFRNTTNAFGTGPSPANFMESGKRPLSSMSPIIILDKDHNVKMVTGAAGGTRIMSTMALVILRALRFGQDLKTATDASRFYHQLLPTELEIEENSFSEVLIEGLRAKGHTIETCNQRLSVVQTVFCQDGYLFGASDDRKGGTADGY